jgi:hypothetical protein
MKIEKICCYCDRSIKSRRYEWGSFNWYSVRDGFTCPKSPSGDHRPKNQEKEFEMEAKLKSQNKLVVAPETTVGDSTLALLSIINTQDETIRTMAKAFLGLKEMFEASQKAREGDESKKVAPFVTGNLDAPQSVMQIRETLNELIRSPKVIVTPMQFEELLGIVEQLAMKIETLENRNYFLPPLGPLPTGGTVPNSVPYAPYVPPTFIPNTTPVYPNVTPGYPNPTIICETAPASQNVYNRSAFCQADGYVNDVNNADKLEEQQDSVEVLHKYRR